MNTTKFGLSLLALVFYSSSLVSAQETFTYKQIGSTELVVQAFYPEKFDTTESYPAMIFFFGGGWINGGRGHFSKQARYFAKRGLVTFLADYRTEQSHQTSPFESLKDAKSAIRFIRANADQFHIDPSKIIASGGSAGGHLAAATALIVGYNDVKDDLTISSIPNALVLFNPVIDNGPGGYGYERIGAKYKFFSPIHNIKKGAPPTIMFMGTDDHLIPVETVKYYDMVMKKVNSISELHLYEGQGHGFFNYEHFEYYKKTLAEADRFLQSLGFLNPEPKIPID